DRPQSVGKVSETMRRPSVRPRLEFSVVEDLLYVQKRLESIHHVWTRSIESGMTSSIDECDMLDKREAACLLENRATGGCKVFEHDLQLSGHQFRYFQRLSLGRSGDRNAGVFD